VKNSPRLWEYSTALPASSLAIKTASSAAGHRARRETLLTLSRQAKERGWWQSYGSAIPEWFQVYVGLEAEASSVRVYESELVHGLLQTPDYYRAFLRAAPAAADEDEAERKIEVRLARQERLTDDDPPDYWAVLNEAVIRRVVGGADVMRRQLDHIAEMAKLPHVNVQVLPFGAGVHPAMDGSFEILGFPEPTDPAVVYLENQAGSLYLEEEAEIDRYERMFSHLIAKALDPEESRRMIARVARDLTDLPTREVRDGRDGPVPRCVAEEHVQQQRRFLR